MAGPTEPSQTPTNDVSEILDPEQRAELDELQAAGFGEGDFDGDPHLPDDFWETH